MASKDRKNDTKYKKNNNLPGVIGSIDKYLGILLKALTILGLLASLLATISLIYYAHEEKVNIFSHYSSWVSALSVITFMELLVGLSLTILAFYPAGTFYFLNNPLYDEKTPGCKNKIGLVFLSYIILIVTPIAVVTFDWVSERYTNLFWGCLLVLLLISAGALTYCEEKRCFGPLPYKNSICLGPLSFGKRKCPGLFLAYFFANVLAIYSAFLAAYFFLSPFDSGSWDSAVLIDLLFLGLVLLVVYPSKRDHPRIGLFVFFILIVGFVIPLITPFSAKISKVALKALDMGGGKNKVYYVTPNNLSKLPKQFIDWNCCVKNFCLTKTLSIKWEVGDLIYARLPEMEAEAVSAPPAPGPSAEKSKQSIALPRNILLPYNLFSGMPLECKTQEELIRAACKENEQ
jgi:hypothetical protein